MTSYFNAIIKTVMLLVVPFLTAVLLFYLPQKNEALKQSITVTFCLVYSCSKPYLYKRLLIQIPKEEFLSSVALMVIAFTPENKEPRLLLKASSISAYLGANYCINFLFLVGLAVVFSFLPLR